VRTDYHGTIVEDRFQWLERAEDPAVIRWTAMQNRSARNHLDKLSTRSEVQLELQRLLNAVGPGYGSLKARQDAYFALKFQPPAQQAALVTFHSLTNLADERTILDPNLLDSQGTTSVDFYEPSRDGKFVAVSLSEKGSEAGTLRVYETATGRKLADSIPRVNFPTGGGSIAWNEDSSGFFYTRYPAPGEKPEADQRFFQQVYFHKLGTAVSEDRYEIGRDFPRIAEIELTASDDARHIVAAVANGDGGEYAYHLRTPSGQWRQIAGFSDGVKQVAFGRDPLYIEWPRDNALYLLSRKDAPKGKILRVPLEQPTLQAATEAIRESTNVIEGFVLSSSGIYIEDIEGGPSTVRFHDFYMKARADAAREDDESDAADENENKDEQTETANQDSQQGNEGENSRRGRRERGPRNEWRLPLQGTFSVQEMFCPRGDQLIFRTVGFTSPYEWRVYNPSVSRSRAQSTELEGKSPADFRDIEVVHEYAISKDGTRIPMSIIRRKGTRLDGKAPTILTGYGGFGITTKPRFDLASRVWLDQGGMVAVANLRGGDEYGEAWHQAGRLTKKQNVFDDFIACAELLIRSNYTSSARLAIEGGSNGGLLMGAALTQRPELFRAVVAHVGIFDMLRVELDPNGQFNTTEFGTVKVAEQFQALHAYSPYHRVQDRTPYPAVLFLTGEHDGRVNPAHSKKMTARLQAATSSRHPVLLRTSANSGHGIGTALEERIAQLVDVYSFLFEELGVNYSVVARGPWVGAVAPTTAWAKARLAHSGQVARLAVSTSPTLWRPRYFGPVQSDSNHYNVVSFPLDRLKPDTQYYYAVEVDGQLDRVKRGKFRTFPENPQSFTFAFASCARTASTSDVFDAIRENNPLFYMNIGDFHYLDLTNANIGKFREAYDLVLTSPQQAELYRSTAFFYMWDDHDYGGNNANKKALSQHAVRQAYQEYVPHYPLGSGGGDAPIFQSFNVGRVKFIVTDLRSERDSVTNKDDAAKSMMGARQKQWFKNELLESNGKFPLIFWISTVPWLGLKGTNYYRVTTNDYGYLHHTTLTNSPSTRTNRDGGGRRGGGGRGGPPRGPGIDDQDHWSMYSTERTELCDFIKANHIQGLAILHGDSHMLAADDGSHSDFATGGGVRIPVMCGAPLDQNASLKGGPYSQGVYRMRAKEGGFGLVTVTDYQNEIEVKYSGRNNKNEEKISLRFMVPVGSSDIPARTIATSRPLSSK
jgi:prolyl oligopeptidase